MKKMHKVITVLLAFALLTGAAMCLSSSADAKLKTVKKYTMYVGDKSKWYVHGTGNKKVRYSSSNKKIATVSKKGIIKAKKKGKCTLTAKAGKGYTKIKLTVKKKIKATTPAPVATAAPTRVPVVTPTRIPAATATPTRVPDTIVNNQLAANMLVTKTVLPSNKLLISITNNNTVQVASTTLSMAFYDAAGAPVKTDTQYELGIDPAETRYLVVNKFSTEIDYSKTAISVACRRSEYSTRTKYDVSCTAQANAETGDIILTCVNSNAVKVYLNGVTFFKDAAGAVIDAREFYESIEAGATKYVTIKAPYDSNYKDMDYTSYEIKYYADH